ncbi:hypothetical protein V6N12_012210 [Hibiscus sabdariffa]|uniref:Uncharacterized protein n=1 Tax=Hibiscus sabdariffa TaxID=183260 RepID=A0ABR2CHH1_9ROSI
MVLAVDVRTAFPVDFKSFTQSESRIRAIVTTGAPELPGAGAGATAVAPPENVPGAPADGAIPTAGGRRSRDFASSRQSHGLCDVQSDTKRSTALKSLAQAFGSGFQHGFQPGTALALGLRRLAPARHERQARQSAMLRIRVVQSTEGDGAAAWWWEASTA